GEDRVAYRDGVRHAERLQRHTAELADTAVPVQADAAYLITGGMGALGLRVARWLVEQGARHLVLTGRGAPSAKAQAVIDELTAAGARVEIGRADVADAAQLAALFARLAAEMPPLRGVVHAAGVLDDGVLLQQSWARFEKVLAPKVAGTWHLHELTREMPLDFFVLFSSSAAIFGSPGQGNYAAANAFLDAVAQLRRSQGLPALSLNWGAWADAGMAAGVGSQNLQRWAAMGVELIAPEQGMQLLGQLLPQDAARLGVFPIRWGTFMKQFGGFMPPFLAELAPAVETAVAPTAAADGAAAAAPDLVRQLDEALAGERRALLQAHVRRQALKILGLDAGHPVAPGQALLDLGLDSLMAVELRNALSADVGQPLPATLLFDHPSIAALTDYLSQDVLAAHMAGAGNAADKAPAQPLRPIDAEEPIAIVGMSGRFPGAPSLDAYWALLRDSVDAISEVPAARWSLASYYDPEPGAPGKMYTRWGGFMPDVDRFDAPFFGISPREAMEMDPQQRLLLEVSWEALERAGVPPGGARARAMGIFVGIGQDEYGQHQLNPQNLPRVEVYDGTGNGICFAAGRLSYVLRSQGPSLVVDTACSSSLVALHLA
ncbi:MAG: SDR family NAD(P)-dependent oxidoreductase, partial [Anaerolineales bacterium]|nr:SDR family NAD(P)-dependent oxidoreductase [Anaerolineales bacterium]